MGQAEERWIRQNVYRLKRLFPCSISLHQNSSVGVNYSTGLKNDTKIMAFIQRAALLPNKSSRAQGPASIQMTGLYDSRDRIFLVSSRDVPAGFPIDNNLEVVHDDKRYKVKAIETFGSEAYSLECTWLEGRPANKVVTIVGEDVVDFTDQGATA